MANPGRLDVGMPKHHIDDKSGSPVGQPCIHVACRTSQGSHSAVSIAESVQAFITTMDSLKLNMAAVDQARIAVTDIAS